MNAPAEWRFRRMQPGEMNIDPIEAEFFSTEALGGLADALVREAIQNSLDARRPGERLKIRMFFPSGARFLQSASAEAYLRGLAQHLNSSHSGLDAERLPQPREPLSFMVIEDFGTRGLRGDPAQSEDTAELEPAKAERNDFFYFWRNIGRSRKHAEELGRWGLGKTVFQAASRINSFFALTVRADDRRCLLLGQSVLKIHRLGGARFYPYGYFGQFKNDFALPIDDDAQLTRFARDFGLERRGEPGLSVVLPYPDADLTPHAVMDSVLRHYFMPILAGDLFVDVVHDGKTERLDAAALPKLFAVASRADSTSRARTFELARWSIALPAEEHTRIAPPPEAVAPRWHDDCLDKTTAEALRERFDLGHPVAIRVPVWVKGSHEESKLATFDVYLERDEALEHADEHFVRDGITVTGARAGLPRGIRAIVTIRDHSLSGLLGDSENPAHTEWQERSPKFKDRYRHGAYTLRYVRNAPRELVRLLTRHAEGRDYTLLKQLFALATPTEAELSLRSADQDKPGAGQEHEARELQTVGKDALFALQKLRGGFRVKGVAEQTRAPKAAVVRVAYEVRRGNPFRQYQPLDFDLAKAPIEIETRNVTVAACEGNVLIVRPQQRDFDLTVRGFDRHRDLRVKVVPAAESVV